MFRSAFLVLVVIASLALPAAAQRGGGGGGRMGGGGGGMGMPGGFPAAARVNKAEQVSKELKIESKMKDVESIFDEAQRQYNTIMNPGVGNLRTQLVNAVVKGSDTAEMTKQEAVFDSQLAGVEADALGKVLALAEAKQRSKAAKVFEIMSGMFGNGDWRNRP